MKSVFFALVTALVLSSTSAVAQSSSGGGFQICGLGGFAMFDSANVFNCKITLNTCQTSQLQSQGWVASPNGTCPKTLSPTAACGMGISELVNPQDPRQKVTAMNTCEARALTEMGFVYAQ